MSYTESSRRYYCAANCSGFIVSYYENDSLIYRCGTCPADMPFYLSVSTLKFCKEKCPEPYVFIGLGT